MIHGLDTGFLIAFEVQEHPDHPAARATLSKLIADGHKLALAPQVLAEFLHIVTDAKRFQTPLTMPQANAVIDQWWTSRDVIPVYAGDLATRQFLIWLRQHFPGRKRLLDTLLVATYWQAGVLSLLTTNPADFTVFGCFHCVTPQG